MPLKHRDWCGEADEQRISGSGRSQVDGIPANFLLGIAIYPCPQGFRQELGAQTDAQEWYTLPQHAREKSVFIAQKWILGFVVDAHRPSHDDDRLILLSLLREMSVLI